MIFQDTENLQSTIALIQHQDGTKKYNVSISVCPNPACYCRMMEMDFDPLPEGDSAKPATSYDGVRIDLHDKKPGWDDYEKPSTELLEFTELVFEQLTDEDFLYLHRWHFADKNEITENTPPEEIEAFFDNHEVEEGMKVAYNEILPFGNQLTFMYNDRKYALSDLYCIVPDCDCTDTLLEINTFDPIVFTGEFAGAVMLTDNRECWTYDGDKPFPTGIGTLKAEIEKQIPDFCRLLQERHQKLKTIYANSRRKQVPSRPPLPNKIDTVSKAPKVGRNDPCPCGSGKKYKKCCLNA